MGHGSTWGFLQLCMAGGFLVTAINLRYLSDETAAPQSPTAVAVKAAINPQLPRVVPKEVPAPAKYTEPEIIADINEPTTFVDRSESIKSIGEFALMPMSEIARDWVRQMNQDEHADPNPLFDRSAIHSIALILDRGIKSFTRESFKGPDVSLGFDMVRYEITQNDDTTSYVLAFRKRSIEKTTTEDRPVLSMFLVSRNREQMYLSLYQEGQPSENRLIERQDAEENYVPTKVANAGWMRR